MDLRGPNFATVSACASSTNAMIDAFNYIRLGMADVIISGGSEAIINEAGIGGFNAMHALSTEMMIRQQLPALSIKTVMVLLQAKVQEPLSWKNWNMQKNAVLKFMPN